MNYYNLIIWSIMTVSGFTQILWESTTEIGLTFGYKENEYIVIAAYNPAGNWEGYYRMNVHPPINNRPAIDLQIHGLSYQTGDYILYAKKKVNLISIFGFLVNRFMCKVELLFYTLKFLINLYIRK